jgi:hypothetical protein
LIQIAYAILYKFLHGRISPNFFIGVRTLRFSIEVSRCAALFHAKGTVREHFNARLTEELRKKSIQRAEILKILWQCENFFENENRECAGYRMPYGSSDISRIVFFLRHRFIYDPPQGSLLS